MKWKDYAELIGITAVVLSLIFLTYELRQNTIALEQAAAADYADSWRNIDLFVAGNPEFALILEKRIRGQEISPTERFQVNVFYRSVFRSWQNSYLQYHSGILNEDIWQAEVSFLEGVLENDQGMMLHWQLEQDFLPTLL